VAGHAPVTLTSRQFARGDPAVATARAGRHAGGDLTMGNRTGIEWTDATWNPVRGCSRVSEGCRHCYAYTVVARFSGPGQPYGVLARRTSAGEARWTCEVRFVPEHLADPLRWQRPRRISINSMSDLFHERPPTWRSRGCSPSWRWRRGKLSRCLRSAPRACASGRPCTARSSTRSSLTCTTTASCRAP
jgi:hypothetical protein